MNLNTPLEEGEILNLYAGQRVDLSGILYSARDATHRKLFQALEAGEELPVSLEGEVIYYMGPTPPRPGRIVGAAGPTTSSRMDPYTPRLLELGLKGMVGKGKRGEEVRRAIVRHRAVYFIAIGGAGALAAKKIKKFELVAYPELGPEALYRLEVEDFPLVVANDAHGNDVFEMAKRKR